MEPAQRDGRAVALVALATTVGALLLALGFEDVSTRGLQGLPTHTPEPVSAPTPDVTPTPEPIPTEEPQPSLAPASTVRVLVANATDVAGAAAVAADTLIATFGYNALPPANTTTEPNVLPSAVYHGPDHAGDARQIAELLGISTDAIGPMPTDPPVADLADADVLVVLGPDLVIEAPE